MSEQDTLAPVGHPLTGPFWTAAAEGRLVMQRCESCGELRWPPLAGCPECRSRDTSWVQVRPNGTIWSLVTYHRAFQAELKADIPYTVVMVQLDDAPCILGRLAPDSHASIGDRVTAEFAQVNGVPQLRWRTEDSHTASGGSDGKA